ncbi:MAG: NADPH dehydrogenase [Bavariicoccus seileri]|uniref:oxidoreductase n=1 Tax=Bavariicoccus seileri TaxID=549685 RepID=UPI003F93082A
MSLLDPITIKQTHFKNRVVMPPMCQYSVIEKNGIVNSWHWQHYVSRAVGGAGTIIIEMTDVDPDGRITDFDLGLWEDAQVAPLKSLVSELKTYGATVGIQIAHAGRKAEDASQPVAPSAIRFPAPNYKTPHALSTQEAEKIVQHFQDSARRAVDAGVDFIELHGAHGYLIHEFQSALTNHRTDKYGKDLALFGVEVVEAVKAVIPEEMILQLRISAVEYAPNGYQLDHSIQLIKRYMAAGVDTIHVSSGGEGPTGPNKLYAGYQVDYAKKIKDATNAIVTAVGLLHDPAVANAVIASNKADFVAVGRGILKDPYWTLHAGETLHLNTPIPKAYQRGFRIR